MFCPIINDMNNETDRNIRNDSGADILVSFAHELRLHAPYLWRVLVSLLVTALPSSAVVSSPNDQDSSSLPQQAIVTECFRTDIGPHWSRTPLFPPGGEGLSTQITVDGDLTSYHSDIVGDVYQLEVGGAYLIWEGKWEPAVDGLCPGDSETSRPQYSTDLHPELLRQHQERLAHEQAETD